MADSLNRPAGNIIGITASMAKLRLPTSEALT
jgi:hypothetical protein